ncbi:MAG TPA: hypothetical protein VLD65_07095 [Anaerolineales bacterium]|nr:hypothetical protein [Anaerolineales bacterium]
MGNKYHFLGVLNPLVPFSVSVPAPKRSLVPFDVTRRLYRRPGTDRAARSSCGSERACAEQSEVERLEESPPCGDSN